MKKPRTRSKRARQSKPQIKSSTGRHRIFTIGHEGVALDEVMGALKEAKVSVLVELRYHASKSFDRVGFTRAELHKACEAAGIEYRCKDQPLAAPEVVVEALEREDYRNAWNSYEAAIDTANAFCEIDKLHKEAKVSNVCLLGETADHRICHRHIASARIGHSKSSIFAFDIINLRCNGQRALIPN